MVVRSAASAGITVRSEDVRFPQAPEVGLRALTESVPVVFLGSENGGARDVYEASARFSPEGSLVEIRSPRNLTRTEDADERGLVARGDHTAWWIGAGESDVVFVLERGGEKLPERWSAVQRVQKQVETFQLLGTFDVPSRRSLRLPHGCRVKSLSDSSEALDVVTSQGLHRVAWDGIDLGLNGLPAHHLELGEPGNIVTWAAERLRDSFVGERGVELLKLVGFAGRDYADRLVGAVTDPDGSERASFELAVPLDLIRRAPVDRHTGWPPAPLTPILSQPLEGEGQWVPLAEDPFVAQWRGEPTPLSVSFVRPDPKRPHTLAYVAIWDPRRIELHAVSGTLEPKSSTGEFGDGLIPRDPRVMGRLVGAFNGGFRSRHGQFGMMTERRVHLPPKPYAATVARLDDGSTAFGTWPARGEIPESIVSFRQNLTPLIQNGVDNPYRRHFWGGMPEGWQYESFTVRTALCLTEEGFVAYVYGTSLSPSTLITAARAARCTYALHLDMNAGHTGFELYRVTRSTAAQTDAGSRAASTKYQARGPVPHMSGYQFATRRLVRGMALMNFPRYLDRQARDFFYLTLVPQVPTVSLPTDWVSDPPGSGWLLEGLPQHGWPSAVAYARIQPEPGWHAHLLELDPRRLEPGGSGPAVVSFRAPDARTPHSQGAAVALWWTRERFSLQARAPAGAKKIAALPPTENGPAALATTPEGTLLYVELEGDPPRSAEGPKMARAILHRLRCQQIIGLNAPWRSRFPSTSEDHDQPADQSELTFTRALGPRGETLFADTPVVPPEIWAFAQRRGP